ncbi:hypothetical protein CK203_019608 [Vitis vinifera]|uniref:Uncharacterized protein n=2 Tax=Vitis vinifera TaxID=29760 RepID=A0A438JQS2_VITVI|nr:hypothetical protein CK203_019608 [Vitis vinifera]
MCGGDDHLAWKRPVSSEACRRLSIAARGIPFLHMDAFKGLQSLFGYTLGLVLPHLVSSKSRGELSSFFERLDMDQRVVTVDPFTIAMASIQEALASLSSSAWDDLESILVASLPAKFKMPDIGRYTGVGCSCIHLRLYSTVMRVHGLDESLMITMFPLSLSGAT